MDSSHSDPVDPIQMECDRSRTSLLNLARSLLNGSDTQWNSCQVKHEHLLQRFVKETEARACFFYEVLQAPAVQYQTNSDPHQQQQQPSSTLILLSAAPPTIPFVRLVFVLKSPSCPPGRLHADKLAKHVLLFALSSGSGPDDGKTDSAAARSRSLSSLGALGQIVEDVYKPLLNHPANHLGLPGTLSSDLLAQVARLRNDLTVAEAWLSDTPRAVLPLPRMEEILVAELGSIVSSVKQDLELTPAQWNLIHSTRGTIADLVAIVWQAQVDRVVESSESSATGTIGEKEKEEEHYVSLCSRAASSRSISCSPQPTWISVPTIEHELEHWELRKDQLQDLARQLDSPAVLRVQRLFEAIASAASSDSLAPTGAPDSPDHAATSPRTLQRGATHTLLSSMRASVSRALQHATSHVSYLSPLRPLSRTITTSGEIATEAGLRSLLTPFEQVLKAMELLWAKRSSDNNSYGSSPMRLARIYRLLANQIADACGKFVVTPPSCATTISESTAASSTDADSLESPLNPNDFFSTSPSSASLIERVNLSAQLLSHCLARIQTHRVAMGKLHRIGTANGSATEAASPSTTSAVSFSLPSATFSRYLARPTTLLRLLNGILGLSARVAMWHALPELSYVDGAEEDNGGKPEVFSFLHTEFLKALDTLLSSSPKPFMIHVSSSAHTMELLQKFHQFLDQLDQQLGTAIKRLLSSQGRSNSGSSCSTAEEKRRRLGTVTWFVRKWCSAPSSASTAVDTPPSSTYTLLRTILRSSLLSCLTDYASELDHVQKMLAGLKELAAAGGSASGSGTTGVSQQSLSPSSNSFSRRLSIQTSPSVALGGSSNRPGTNSATAKTEQHASFALTAATDQTINISVACTALKSRLDQPYSELRSIQKELYPSSTPILAASSDSSSLDPSSSMAATSSSSTTTAEEDEWELLTERHLLLLQLIDELARKHSK